MREAVVVETCFLVGDMFQRVPLAADLGVEVDFVVEGFDVEGLAEVDEGLFEFLTAETAELHVGEGPVELDVFACLDLAGGFADDGGGEEVDGADFVFFAAFVEEAPETALGLAFDFREVVEGGEVGSWVGGAGHGGREAGEAVAGYFERIFAAIIGHDCSYTTTVGNGYAEQ